MDSHNIFKEKVLLFSLILWSVLFLRDILNLNIIGPLFVIITSILLVFLNKDECKQFIFTLIPLCCGIPGYTMLIAYITLLFKNKHSVNTNQIFPTIFISLIDIIDNIYHLGNIDISAHLSFISFIGVLFYMIFDRDIKKNSNKALFYFTLSTCFTLFLIYLNMINIYEIDEILTGRFRGAMGIDSDINIKEGHLILNANSLAYYAITLLGCLLFTNGSFLINKYIHISVLIFTVFCGLLSFSRTFLLLTIISILIYLIYKKSFKILSILVSLSIILFITFSNFFIKLFDTLFSRLNDDTMATGGGRTIIFDRYNDLWLDNGYNFLFGIGLSDYKSVSGFSRSMHNGTQQIYVCLGLIGFIIFLYYFYKYFRINYTRYHSFIRYIPFLLSLSFVQSIQFLKPSFLILIILPTFYAFQLNKKN